MTIFVAALFWIRRASLRSESSLDSYVSASPPSC